jgi:hypothetical protein
VTYSPGSKSLHHSSVSHQPHSERAIDIASPANIITQKGYDSRESSSNEKANSSFTGEISPSNCIGKLSHQVDVESSPRKSFDIAESGQHSEISENRSDQMEPIILPPIIGDSRKFNPQRWGERVAFLQRWLVYAEVKYKCPVDS